MDNPGLTSRERMSVNAHTVNVIAAGLCTICTPAIITSINSASAVSDKLGHSCEKEKKKKKLGDFSLPRGGMRTDAAEAGWEKTEKKKTRRSVVVICA